MSVHGKGSKKLDVAGELFPCNVEEAKSTLFSGGAQPIKVDGIIEFVAKE